MDGTIRDMWWKTTFIGGGYNEKLERLAQMDSESALLQRMGSAEAMAFDREIQRTGAMNRLKGTVTFD